MEDFADRTDPRMNEAAWRALDLTHAYVARDRTAIVEHLADLEEDQLTFAGGVLITMYNDTREVLRNTGRPHNPATVVREVDAVARFAPTEHEFAVTTASRRKVFGLATAGVRLAWPLARQTGSQCSSCARVLATARMRRCSGGCSRGRTRWIVRLGAPRSGRQVRPAGAAVTAASPAGARVTPSRRSR